MSLNIEQTADVVLDTVDKAQARLRELADELAAHGGPWSDALAEIADELQATADTLESEHGDRPDVLERLREYDYDETTD